MAGLDFSSRIAAGAPAGTGSIEGVQFRQEKAAAVLALDRPEALGAITMAMRRRWAAILPGISRDIMTYILLLESTSERAFSAGGDLKELVQLAARDPELARQSFREEYGLNWMLECFSKPSVALINGLVIGGGVGLTMFTTHRVAGEKYAFSMPETGIGFFPDDGLAYFFARMPSSIGVYLGLTGRRIGRADAFTLQLATHCIDSEYFAVVERELADANPVDPILDDLHRHPGEGELARVQEIIGRCFSAPTVEEIVGRLEAEPEQRAWCGDVLGELAARSPLALKVTLRHIRMARGLDIRQTLQIDYRLACRMLERPDFVEGVRARMIDKDGSPRWQPAQLADVTPAMVEDCFSPMPGRELVLPTRQEMQASRI